MLQPPPSFIDLLVITLTRMKGLDKHVGDNSHSVRGSELKMTTPAQIRVNILLAGPGINMVETLQMITCVNSILNFLYHDIHFCHGSGLWDWLVWMFDKMTGWEQERLSVSNGPVFVSLIPGWTNFALVICELAWCLGARNRRGRKAVII